MFPIVPGFYTGVIIQKYNEIKNHFHILYASAVRLRIHDT